MNQDQCWAVLKFGGTSVSSVTNWKNISKVVRDREKQGYSVCVVHSALKGISNLLEQVLLSEGEREVYTVVKKIKEQHLSFAADLGLDGSVLLVPYFDQLEELAAKWINGSRGDVRIHARILALGELMSTQLGSEFLIADGLKICWKDARDCLKSIPQQNTSREQAILSAVCGDKPDAELQEQFSDVDGVILTQGFIASDKEGKTVLLGRGGSDVSAAYLAAKLNAKRLEIWTDVPGLFSTDPGQVPSARLLEKLSYEEAQEIAANGAGVLHPRCINPARRHHIPIHVHCTPRPDLPGTIINGRASNGQGVLKSVALRDHITLVSMESLGMWQKVGFLADAFSVFKQFGLSIDLVSTSESNVTVSLDPSLNIHFDQIREEFTTELSRHCKVEIIDSVSAISLLGQNVHSILHQVGDLFQIFQDYEIYMVSQASNNLNFTFAVNSDRAEQLVHQLHEQIIMQPSNQSSLGSPWSELMGAESTTETDRSQWWEKESRRLQELGKRKGSAYVYSKKEVERNIQKVQQLDAIDHYFYAMKANNNPDVLQQFYDAGLGFECVSIGEIQLVFKLFPQIERERILFTPNFAPRNEYKLAIEYGIHLTLDNIYPLREWPGIFENQPLFLRIDPGHGYGHHKYVKTGGNYSKFGIPLGELSETAQLVDEIGAKVVGLHAHTGSGIKDETQWEETGLILAEVAKNFGDVKILDLGGGFGVAENEVDSRLSLERVNRRLKNFKINHPRFELWIEPGRFLVASAGVLLTTVTQLKGKGGVGYVGVETGMNSLIRPALYGSNHTIVNLTKLDQPASKLVNVVGPICESGDKLGVNRHFPDSDTGDIVLVANTGAYGYVMSSNYNLRPPAEEVYLEI